MSGTLKSPVTITLGRVSFGYGIFSRASSSCCTLKVFAYVGQQYDAIVEVCFPLFQAWPKLPHNASTLHATYLSDTATQTPPPPKDLSLRNMSKPFGNTPLM